LNQKEAVTEICQKEKVTLYCMLKEKLNHCVSKQFKNLLTLYQLVQLQKLLTIMVGNIEMEGILVDFLMVQWTLQVLNRDQMLLFKKMEEVSWFIKFGDIIWIFWTVNLFQIKRLGLEEKRKTVKKIKTLMLNLMLLEQEMIKNKEFW